MRIARLEGIANAQIDTSPPALDNLSDMAPDDVARLFKDKKRLSLPERFEADILKRHSRPVQPLSWFVDRWMPDATLTVLTGAGGAGKSRLAMQLSVAAAGGAKYFIWPAFSSDSNVDYPKTPKLNTGGPVPSYTQLGRRATRMAAPPCQRVRQPPGRPHSSWDDMLHYVNMRPYGGLWGAERGVHISAVGGWLKAGHLLLDYAAKIKPKLLVLDPLAAAFVQNENDRALVRAFLSALDQWAEDETCAVLIISHPPKAKAPSPAAPIGATACKQYGRWMERRREARTDWNPTLPESASCASTNSTKARSPTRSS